MIHLGASICLISNFYWRDALWLRSWDFCVFPEPKIEQNIMITAGVMQKIRDYLDCPITVTSWLRPKIYNEFIGGAPKSAHLDGLAVDFVVEGMHSDEVRHQLLNKLDEWMIRMEDAATPHVHIDLKDVPAGGSRFFKP